MNSRPPLLLVLIAICSCGALTVVEPVYLTLNSPQSITTGAASFNVSARMVVPVPPNGCQPITNQDEVAGNILLISGEDCALEVKARHAQSAAAVAVVQHEVLAVVAGLNYAFYIEPDRADITIPIVFVAGTDGTTLLELMRNTSAVWVTVVSGEVNQWQLLASSVHQTIVTVVHGLGALLLLVFGVYKMQWYYRHKHTLLSVAQLSLSLLVLSASSVLVNAVVSQLSMRGYMAMSAVLYLGLILIAWTLLMLSSLVISFYWFELTARVSAVSKAWSHRLWRPFLSAGSVLVCALVVILLWMRYFRVVAVLYAMLAVFAIIALAVVVLWLVFGLKLRHSLLHAPAQLTNTARYQQLYRRIVAAACSLLVVFGTVAAGSWVGTAPVAMFVVMTLAGFSLEAAIFIQIIMFSTKKKTTQSASTPATSI